MSELVRQLNQRLDEKDIEITKLRAALLAIEQWASGPHTSATQDLIYRTAEAALRHE